MDKQLACDLNQPSKDERLTALGIQMARFTSGELAPPAPTGYVNNHIHTIYSFSPYSPTAAAYAAWANGLTTAGIMDHDSVSGAREFVEAGERVGIATTVGFECRVKMDATPFAGRRLNNPDQLSVAYVACHGIPHQSLPAADAWLAPLREKRGLRNRQMVENLNGLLAGSGVRLSYDADVLPLSRHGEGGSVTERHILYALAFAVVRAVGKGRPAVDFAEQKLGMPLSEKQRAVLADAATPGYEYALLGAFKGGLVERFFVPATDECPDVAEFIAFTRQAGAVPAYAYLGDVGDSVTGDKKAQEFEDGFLDELMPWLAQAGFLSVTYMPTRNTPAQLARVIRLCAKHNLFEISGEDINSPAQSFICKALDLPEYKHLVTNTWALIGHERAATQSLANGMFSAETLAAMPGLARRIEHFAALGRVSRCESAVT